MCKHSRRWHNLHNKDCEKRRTKERRMHFHDVLAALHMTISTSMPTNKRCNIRSTCNLQRNDHEQRGSGQEERHCNPNGMYGNRKWNRKTQACKQHKQESMQPLSPEKCTYTITTKPYGWTIVILQWELTGHEQLFASILFAPNAFPQTNCEKQQW